MTLFSKSIDDFQETMKNGSHKQEILKLRVNQIIELVNTIKIEEINLFQFFRIHLMYKDLTLKAETINLLRWPCGYGARVVSRRSRVRDLLREETFFN